MNPINISLLRPVLYSHWAGLSISRLLLRNRGQAGKRRRRKPAKGQDLGIGRQPAISAILRRHMNAVTWAEAFEKLIEAKGINSKPGRRWDSNSATVATLAKEVGVPERITNHRLQMAEELKAHYFMWRRAFERRQMLPSSGLCLRISRRTFAG